MWLFSHCYRIVNEQRNLNNIVNMQTDKICRACLREDEKMIDMCENNLYQKFLLFTNLTVEEEIPDIPLNLCKSCEQRLKSSLDFQDECKKSHEILSNYVKNACEVKMDVPEADPKRLEQFSQNQVLDVINDVKRSFYKIKSCIWCSFVGSNRRALTQHISHRHKDLKSRWCCTCNNEFDDLTDHVATNHSDDYTCKFCDKKFSKIGHFIDHLNNHSDLKTLRCLFCKKCFSKRSNLNKHLKWHTKKNDGYAQLTALEVKQHKQEYHKCKYCKKNFRTSGKLIMHERTHIGEKPYCCQVCGRGFAQEGALSTHMKLHNIGSWISCKICDKKYSRPYQLRVHLLTHTGEKPCVCTECGKAFVSTSNLAQHSKTHSNLRPYQCNHCNKSFKTKTLLKHHMWIHSGENPYKCTQCSYACRHCTSLTKHMKKHEVDKPRADKPHVCLICTRTYSTDAMLTYHLKTHDVSFLEI